MASETANMIPPPMPWTPRDRFRISGVEAAPQTADAAVKSTTPEMKTRFRPSRSPSEPAISTTVASMSA